MTKSELLKRLQKAISPEEWESVLTDQTLPVSDFNRGVLLELKAAEVMDERELCRDKVTGLWDVLREYLREHLPGRPAGWKWIIISSIYLTFVAERPMHPVDLLDIKVTAQEGKAVYECPSKSKIKHTTCDYCVCRRMSNYEITKRRMRKEFLKYDQEKMIQKFHLRHDSDYLYISFLGRSYRIDRAQGNIMWSENDFPDANEAEYNDAMTIYDVLCNSAPDCHLSGVFVNMKSLSSIQGGSAPLGNGMFQETEQWLDHKNAALARACEKLNGTEVGKGDVAYQIPMFDFLPVMIRFWNSDEEFQASLEFFMDKNILAYMHYETVWCAVSHLVTRLKEKMSNQ